MMNVTGVDVQPRGWGGAPGGHVQQHARGRPLCQHPTGFTLQKQGDLPYTLVSMRTSVMPFDCKAK